MERLEERQLLAVGPQLISIQPNRGDLLADGQIRHEPPRELLFHFQANASIDASSLPQNPESPTSSDSIQIWRSGQDGSFERASTFTDFGTDGQVVAQFTAKQIGQGGNFIALNFSESTNPQGPAVAVDTVNKQIFIELNIAQPITAAEVVTAIGDHPTASQLVDSSIIRGNGSTNISGSTIADYSPVQLNGANSAKASSDFNFGTELTIEFTAVTAGPAGNGIRINVNGGDLGEVSSSPQILVDGKQIDIIVNSNEMAPTTAADLVSTVNSNPFSSVLVQARILVGDPTLLVGERAGGLPTMVLQGGDDIRVVPGFIGLESNTREVTLRFRDSLVDDIYLINIFGSGPQPLADVNGNPFAEGLDFGRSTADSTAG